MAIVKPARLRALDRALTHVGVTENPPNSNRGLLIDKWNRQAVGVVGVYWCASFVHSMFAAVGFPLWGGGSVSAIVEGARKRKMIVSRPRRGDLVCFDFDQDGSKDDHIGFVVRVLALRWLNGTFVGWVKTCEGNTSSGAAGSQDNGGGVFIRRRWIRGNIAATVVRVT
jgi:hypothetical protein